MKKIITIVGARPQFVKAAMVSHALKQTTNITEIIVHTGQHYDINMSQIFLDELELPTIDYHLHVGSNTHAKQTADMLSGIESLLIKEQPDWLLIYGDTNSTLAGALAAAKLHIPIAHVEAGLRSYNRKMPEEINRIIADQLSQILFTPTNQAVKNLKQEGFEAERILEVGDVMYDAAIFYANKAKKNNSILLKHHCQPHQFILTTIHRAENTDDLNRLTTIFTALTALSKVIPIIMPLHPRTRKTLENNFPQLLKTPTIKIIEPVGFLDMIILEKNAAIIITDSGGMQKEAFYYQVPCITLRGETEWTETIKLGWNRLVPPTDADEIYSQALQTLGSRGMNGQYPYGKGNAAHLIVKHLS